MKVHFASYTVPAKAHHGTSLCDGTKMMYVTHDTTRVTCVKCSKVLVDGSRSESTAAEIQQ